LASIADFKEGLWHSPNDDGSWTFFTKHRDSFPTSPPLLSYLSVTDEQLDRELYRLALVCKSSAITSGVPLESQSETVQRLQTITR